MKTSILLFTTVIFLGCSNEEEKETQEQQLPITVENLVGTWLTIEKKVDGGTGPGPFQTIEKEDRYTITFKSDLSFLNSSNEQCDGFYEVDEEEDDIIFNYENTCPAEINIWSVSSLTKNTLVISQVIADEGVKIKLKKQNF